MPTTISGTTGVSQVQDGVISDADISASAFIAGSKIASGSITSTQLSAEIVSTQNIANNAVTTSKIANANITAAKLNGAQTGSAPIYGCRAWVNFNGARNATDTGASSNGSNVLIRSSGNVSSVLKNSTGDYTITFTTAMPDANYSYIGTCNGISAGGPTSGPNIIVMGSNSIAPTSSTLRVNTGSANNVAFVDMTEVCVAVFR